jgi:hypothetical protein
LPRPLALVAVLAALASLTWSFARDIGWLWRTEQARRAALTRPALLIVPRQRLVILEPATVN